MKPPRRHELKGSLTVVGTGIRFFTQITDEAKRAMDHADHLLYVVDDWTANWLAKTYPSSESLQHFYSREKMRKQTYEEMIDRILHFVRQEKNVCAAFYGHPGIYAYAPHESIRRARAEGYHAVMLPGISAQDCLFVDVGTDPGIAGYQSFEATDFLVCRREFDLNTPLLLWQVSRIGDLTGSSETAQQGVKVLAEFLAEFYGTEHEVILYEAPQQPLGTPVVQRVKIQELPIARIRSVTTLFIPPP